MKIYYRCFNKRIKYLRTKESEEGESIKIVKKQNRGTNRNSDELFWMDSVGKKIYRFNYSLKRFENFPLIYNMRQLMIQNLNTFLKIYIIHISHQTN